jgi:hypothetical protein
MMIGTKFKPKEWKLSMKIEIDARDPYHNIFFYYSGPSSRKTNDKETVRRPK